MLKTHKNNTPLKEHKLIKKIPVKVCPECNSHKFKIDYHNKETYCYLCGLIITAPYSTDFITPELKTIHLTLNIPETIETNQQ